MDEVIFGVDIKLSTFYTNVIGKTFGYRTNIYNTMALRMCFRFSDIRYRLDSVGYQKRVFVGKRYRNTKICWRVGKIDRVVLNRALRSCTSKDMPF